MTDRRAGSATSIVAAVPVAIGLAAVGLDSATTDITPGAAAETSVAIEFSSDDAKLVAEHIFGGLPSLTNIHVRRGYVRSHSPEHRIPSWVAYHVVPDYRRTPTRTGRFSTFRTDRDVQNPVGAREYIGLNAARGYARGHLAPYGVMGGDRNNNGSVAPDDEFDSETVFGANLMSNIAPQHHDGFNGAGGLWFELERAIQDVWVQERGGEFWVFAGPVIGGGEHEKVGPNQDIFVPPMFFKIVISEGTEEDDIPQVLAFLFPHQRIRHGELQDFLVSVDVIEALTNLDFFNEFGEEIQEALEDSDTSKNWASFSPPIEEE